MEDLAAAPEGSVVLLHGKPIGWVEGGGGWGARQRKWCSGDVDRWLHGGRGGRAGGRARGGGVADGQRAALLCSCSCVCNMPRARVSGLCANASDTLPRRRTACARMPFLLACTCWRVVCGVGDGCTWTSRASPLSVSDDRVMRVMRASHTQHKWTCTHAHTHHTWHTCQTLYTHACRLCAHKPLALAPPSMPARRMVRPHGTHACMQAARTTPLASTPRRSSGPPLPTCARRTTSSHSLTSHTRWVPAPHARCSAGSNAMPCHAMPIVRPGLHLCVWGGG